MSTVEEEIKKEIESLLEEKTDLLELANDAKKGIEFGNQYQVWYTGAKKIVEALAPDRLEEFLSYYSIDPKKKVHNKDNYVIQDYVKDPEAPQDSEGKVLFDHNHVIKMRIRNQMQILASLESLIDGIQRDVIGHLFAELQGKELKASSQLLEINPRAAGVIAGVVLECHLKRSATNHEIKLSKKAPAISDLNDSLKEKGVYGVPTWGNIQRLDKLRNKCSDQKGSEPTKDEVHELIDGVTYIIKSVF